MNAQAHIKQRSPGMATTQPLLLMVKIAELLANPARFFHPDHMSTATGGLAQEQFAAFCQTQTIGKRLNAALACELGVSAIDLQPAAIASPDVAQICNLVIAPDSAIEAFLSQVTAVRLQQAIRNCVLKADREQVRGVLGDAAYNTALREAPFFFADLADASVVHFDASAGLGAGAATTHSYVASIDKGLAQIFAWRMPKSFTETEVSLDDTQLRLFARLLASKGPQAGKGRA